MDRQHTYCCSPHTSLQRKPLIHIEIFTPDLLPDSTQYFIQAGDRDLDPMCLYKRAKSPHWMRLIVPLRNQSLISHKPVLCFTNWAIRQRLLVFPFSKMSFRRNEQMWCIYFIVHHCQLLYKLRNSFFSHRCSDKFLTIKLVSFFFLRFIS